MNHDLDPDAPLDARAAAAADDLRAVAARRPVPTFTPDRLPTPLPAASGRSRRPLAIAAAVLLVAGAVGGAVALTRGGDGDGNLKAAGVDRPRPFVAGALPDGLQLAGVFSSDDAAADEEALLGRFHLYADDGTPVAGIALAPPIEELVDDVDGDGEITGDERPEVVTVDGTEVWHIQPVFGTTWSAVDHGDRTVVAIAPDLTAAQRDALAAGASLEAGVLRVDPGTVEAWELRAVLDDGMDAFPIAGSRRGIGRDGHQAVYFGGGGETGLTVTSTAAQDGAIEAMTLLAPDHGPVRVRGRDGLLVRFPVDEHTPDMVSVSWEERPGERVTVGGIGLTEAQVLAIAEDVRPAAAEEWQILERDTRLGRLSDVVNHEGTAVDELAAGELPGGVVYRVTWLTPSSDADPARGPQVEGLDVTLRVPGSDSTGSTSWDGPAPFGETVVAGSGGRHLAAGIVDEAVVTVRIERSDGSVVGEHEVRAAGGHRAWAAELVEDGLVAVALDASGAELTRMPVPRSGDGVDGGFEGEGTSDTMPCTTVEEPDGSGRFSCQGAEIDPVTSPGD